MHSPVQIFAGIRLNLSSVERFCEIACGLADDNPEIQTGVWEAAREARSSAQLIDHLRSLFSHQQCIEEQASSVKPATSLQVHVPYLRLAQLTSSATEPKQQPYAYQSQYYSPHYQLAGDESALLFTRTNQLNLCRASKCLLANIAKMLYLTDSVLLPTSDADLQLGPDELASQAFLRQAHNQFQRLEDENRAKGAKRPDNVANYSQLLRSFGELAGQLVDLGHRIALSQLKGADALASAPEAPAWNASAVHTPVKDLLEPLDESSLLGDHMNQLAWSHLDQLQAIGRSQESHIGDMQILFQANRVTNYKCLVQVLNEMFSRASQTGNASSQLLKCNQEPHENKENLSVADKAAAYLHQIPSRHLVAYNFMLMNKRQLINALHSILMTDIKSVLVERAHEFTDCAYTKHEHREAILVLMYCIKMQLNKLVKLIYKLRRKSSAEELELCLGQLRTLAQQLDENCAELEHELQTVVIEQSDELDRCNAQLDLVKQLKHYCLVGDTQKCAQTCNQFQEQAEQLIEVCKMLNQVAPTNKMKITTKTLAIWFNANSGQLAAMAANLSELPRSRVLRECTWAYMQVWCSFYDDFCQMARQVAYLTHSNYDPKRHAYVQAMREQILARRRQGRALHLAPGSTASQEEQMIADQLDELDELADWWPSRLGAPASSQQLLLDDGLGCERVQSEGSLAHATSFQSLNLDQACPAASECTDSPRSLDHYQGFGANYARNYSQLRQHQAHRRPVGLGAYEYGSPAQSYCYELDLGAEPTTPQAGAQLARAGLERPAPQLRFAEPEVVQPPPPPSRRVSAASSCESPRVASMQHAVHQPARPTPRTRRNQRASSRPDDSADADSVLEGAGKTQASDQQSSGSANTDADKWSDSDADAIVRGARETAQMALSMYQFTRGEGDLNTTQDLFTQAELFAEEANELYKEVRCFSYKVPNGDLKKELLAQLSTIPALVQQLQFIVKNPTVGKPATFAKVDNVIRETRSLMEAVNRVVTATLSCRQHYNMASASMRKRTRTLSPSYRADKGFEFDNHGSARQSGLAGRPSGGSAGGMGSEPDI